MPNRAASTVACASRWGTTAVGRAVLRGSGAPGPRHRSPGHGCEGTRLPNGSRGRGDRRGRGAHQSDHQEQRDQAPPEPADQQWARRGAIRARLPRVGVAEQTLRVGRRHEQAVRHETHPIAHDRRGGLEQRIRHPASDQHDQPQHEGHREPPRPRQGLDDEGGDDQDDAEQHGEPIQPPRPQPHPNRIVGRGLQGEGRIPVDQQHLTRRHARVVADEPAQERRDRSGQPTHDERGEPAHEHQDGRHQAQHPHDDELRDQQEVPEQHGEPPLPPGRGHVENGQPLPRSATDVLPQVPVVMVCSRLGRWSPPPR